MAQKMLTKDLLKKLPPMYATEKVDSPDKVLVVKYFTPWSSWTWYGVEYDPIDHRFFGWCDDGRGGAEWGYFSLTELESVRGPWGLKIERDYHFSPKKFSKLNR